MTKTRRRKPKLVRRQFIPLDFDEVLGRGDVNISGSAVDLIRDGYDCPRPWLHNSQALPDDRRKAFLVGRGWSASLERRKALQESGIPWMAVNDYPENDWCKPRYFCTGDPAIYFGERVWADQSIMKFGSMMFHETDRPRIDAYHAKHRMMDSPNVHFFHHTLNEIEFESWLHMPWISWGTSIFGPRIPKQFYEHGAARSSMLIGLRLLWHLGYREVYLLGCDCVPHEHAAPEYWNTIFHLMEQVKPTFDRYHYHVMQTNPDSHLRTFEFADFDDALEVSHH